MAFCLRNSMSAARHAIEDLFGTADIRIKGSRAWDIQIHNARFMQLFQIFSRDRIARGGERRLDTLRAAAKLDAVDSPDLREGK
jgi:hypothetical protein